MTYKPKILIIDNDYNSLIKFRLELLKRLQAFFEVIVLTHTDSKNNFNKYDIDILHFDISRSSLSLGNVIKEFKQIRKVISNKKPVIVLSFTTRCSFLNVMSNYYNNKIKIISVIAGLGNLFQRRDLKGKIVSLIVKKTISKSNLLIVLNNEILNFFNIKNSIMIPGEGVDLIRFKYQPRNRIRKYIFVGRLLKDKGILELVEAFKIVEKINPSLTLKLILSLDNDNPEQISLKDLEKMIGDNINIEINAKNVLADLGSIYYWYQKIMTYRKQNKTLIYGDWNVIEQASKDIYVYERFDEDNHFYVLLNHSDNVQKFELDLSEHNLELHNIDIENLMLLQPWEARLYRKK